MIGKILFILLVIFAGMLIVEGYTMDKIVVGESACKDNLGRIFVDEMCEDYEQTDGFICSTIKIPIFCSQWFKGS